MSHKTPIRPEFGHNLLHLREARQFTIPEMCMTMNMHRRAWEMWEGGHTFPGPHNLIRICRFFQFYDVYRMMTQEIPPAEFRRHFATSKIEQQ